MTGLLDPAFAVSPGDHACSRFVDPEHGERVAAAFVVDGLMRGRKVIYLCDGDVSAFESRIAGWDSRVGRALGRGQLEVRPARESYLPDGRFEPERTIELVVEERSQALAEGYPGLSMTGEMTWALEGAPGTERLAAYERDLGLVFEDETLTGFCQYHEPRFDAGLMADVTSVHAVDVTPALAALARTGYLTGAYVRPDGTLRLTGAVDSIDAGALARVLDEHFADHLRVDLAGVSFLDMAGMRALLGSNGRAVTITKASGAVHRLLAAFGRDGIPRLEVLEERL